MATKRAATTADLPITRPSPDTSLNDIWDPAGNHTPPDQPLGQNHDTHVRDWHQQPDKSNAAAVRDNTDEQAELDEFIAAVRAVASEDTQIETPDSWSN